MNDAAVTITATGLRDSIPQDVPLEDKLRFAMRKVREPNGAAFMCGNDDQMFRGAVGAVMLMCSEEERERIEFDLRNLKILSAMMSGIPVDVDAIKVAEKPLGLVGMWHESKGPAK